MSAFQSPRPTVKSLRPLSISTERVETMHFTAAYKIDYINLSTLLGFVAQFDMFVTKLKLSDNPKEKAGLFNRLTFFYLDGLFRLGSKRPLVEEDLHEPIQCDKAAAVCPRLEAAWNEELTKKLGICI